MHRPYILLLAVCALSAVNAQDATPAPGAPAPPAVATTPLAIPESSPGSQVSPLSTGLPGQPAPIEPPIAPGTPSAVGATTEIRTISSSSGRLNEFQGDDIAQVLRLLARQAKIDLIVSDKITGTVTMRLENKTPLETIKVIVDAKGLIMDKTDDVYYIKTQEEKTQEPTESAFYAFNYAKADAMAPLLKGQLQSGVEPQVDIRTNTIFYRERKSNLASVKLFLETVDMPTKQVMIEARLVEVTANPQQSYGVNWAGTFGSSSAPQTFRYAGSQLATQTISTTTNPVTGASTTAVVPGTLAQPSVGSTGSLIPQDFLTSPITGLLKALDGQFAILDIPSFSATLRLLNEDSDAQFLANPRVVTTNGVKATIKITENQPVPQLNFNEQTATAVFGGFVDKEYGNTLVVTPTINKDRFVTLQVQPEISNKVADATFTFAGATVTSPIIDKRSLDSVVLIKSGDTLAIGGLIQDQTIKGTTKVPILGDIPGLGYLFQEHLNSRQKRNLLVFVTPTIIDQGYGTGLEDQVSGLHHSGEEYADPNGWRNNAKGAIRLVPTSNREVAADYPVPGTPMAPVPASSYYKVDATDRDQ